VSEELIKRLEDAIGDGTATLKVTHYDSTWRASIVWEGDSADGRGATLDEALEAALDDLDSY